MLKDDPIEGKVPLTVALLIEALMAMPPDALVGIPDMHNEDLRTVSGPFLCQHPMTKGNGDRYLYQYFEEDDVSVKSDGGEEDALILHNTVVLLPLGIGWKESP